MNTSNFYFEYFKSMLLIKLLNERLLLVSECFYTVKDLCSSFLTGITLSSLMLVFLMNFNKNISPLQLTHNGLLCFITDQVESSELWNTVLHFVILCFAVKGISNLSTDHWLMYFFRQNRCRIVGINIYKWNIYISQTLGKWSLDYIFNPSRRRRKKHEECSISPSHISISVLVLVVLHHRERYLNVQFYSLSPLIRTATPPLPK